MSESFVLGAMIANVVLNMNGAMFDAVRVPIGFDERYRKFVPAFTKDRNRCFVFYLIALALPKREGSALDKIEAALTAVGLPALQAIHAIAAAEMAANGKLISGEKTYVDSLFQVGLANFFVRGVAGEKYFSTEGILAMGNNMVLPPYLGDNATYQFPRALKQHEYDIDSRAREARRAIIFIDGLFSACH